MGLQIESGTGTGYSAGVTHENRLLTDGISRPIASAVSEDGDAYTITVEDTAPASAEYTLWIQNDSEDHFAIDYIATSNVGADAIWKLHQVTGTGATAPTITPVNVNLSSGKVASLTVLGGAGGVSGLTISKTITEWFGGAAYSRIRLEFEGGLILGTHNAIAIEFDAGTGSKVAITVWGHFYHD